MRQQVGNAGITTLFRKKRLTTGDVYITFSTVDIVVCFTEEGIAPFDDWFSKLDTVAALKVRTALARIEIGNFGGVKPVGQGVSERRITFGPSYRVYLAKTATRS
tara:strand:- start:1896 stop:2210 length:315 start_codon:yes stop_codon:yes gene_type:complete